MIQKSIHITKIHEVWIKERTNRLGISESDILRRLIDKEIEHENEKK